MNASSSLEGARANGIEPDGLRFEGMEWLAGILEDSDARFLLFQDVNALLEEHGSVSPVWLSAHELSDTRLAIGAAVDLGDSGEGARIAMDVCKLSDGEGMTLPGMFQSLSNIQESVDPRTWRTLARARALLAWNVRTARCPSCGATTASEKRGMVRVCTNPACKQPHFPRTDPTVIVRVVRGEMCLLARQPRFRNGLRSVLAGFVEPGETLEEAVRREVAEEVSIEVERIEYLGSQPWPFPMNLMIAFEAHAREAVICIDDDELEAADWYTREQVQHALAEGSLVLPSQKSIARWMIDDWLEDRPDTPRTTLERLAPSR